MDIEIYTTLGIPALAGYLLTKLCARPLHEVSDILAERVRVWRKKNLTATLQEGGEYAHRAQLELKEIPLKALLPLLEGASVEEEPVLRSLWARLLANASAASASVSLCGIAGELLRALSPSDAKVLDALLQEVETAPDSEGLSWGNYRGSPKPTAAGPSDRAFRLVSRDRLLELTGFSREGFELCFDNISRFNIIEAPQRYDLDGRPLDLDHYAFTRLGQRVMTLLNTWESNPDRSAISCER